MIPTVIILAVLATGFIVHESRGRKNAPRFYLFPERKEFIYIQGKNRVLFDSFSYYPLNDDSIGGALFFNRLQPLPNDTPYLAFYRNDKFIAALPSDIGTTDRIPIYTAGNDIAEWMFITEFEKKQDSLINSDK